MPNNNNFDSNQIELSLELVRLSQARAKDHGVRFDNELARQVAEVEIMNLPEDLALMLDESVTMSQSDVLSGALGVNDVVVNGRQIDVRPLNHVSLDNKSEETVSIDRVLIGSQYLAQGSLVVRLDAGRPGVGSVVGYVPPGAWLRAEETQKGGDLVSKAVGLSTDFDLAALLAEISQKTIIKLPSISRITDVKEDVGTLVNNRESLISARQKQIFAYLSTNWTEDTIALVESVPVKFSVAKMQRILGDGARWQGKVDRLVVKLAERFPTLGDDELRSRVLKAGEQYGSQLSAPRYRRALVAELVALEMGKLASKKNAASPILASLTKAQALVEKVLSGISAVDAVKNVISNQVAVDLAFVIQKQRKITSISGLVAATAEELGMAYGQLALSPAYATHSQSEDNGIDSVNEALVLLEASQRAESARAIEMDLANF